VANIGRFAQVLVILTFRNRGMVRGGIIAADIGSIDMVEWAAMPVRRHPARP
jgi:hypothetical protein